MKRLLMLLVFSYVSCTLFAQATDLVVDCQTPGWLSSKINYGDQQTVENLKVTGYINTVDLQFIGTLLGMKLNGTIDLADVNIIGNSWNGKFINTESSQNYTIKKLILPKSLTTYKEAFSHTIVDTLVFDTQITSIENPFERKIGRLIIGDNVDSIKCRRVGEVNGIESISFPTKLKYIYDEAFYNVLYDASTSNISELLSLEYMGNMAFVNDSRSQYTYNVYIQSNKETLPETISLPKVKDFYITAFDYKEGMNIYFGDQLTHFRYKPDIRVGNIYWKPGLEDVQFHFKTSTPPVFHNESNYYNGVYYLPYGLTICVPTGSKDAYEKAIHNGMKLSSNYTIIEEDVPVEQIILNPSSLTLDIGENATIETTLLPYNATNKTLVWTVDDENIVSVSQMGEIKALSSGVANVYASSSDGIIKSSCKVMVKTHASSVSIVPASINIPTIGDTYRLEAKILPESTADKSVTWKSSNEQICTVSETGLVTATGVGSAVVTVTTVDGGLTATCVVKVLQHVDDMTLNKISMALKVGESEKLQATITPNNADNKNIIWTSEDVNIATVDEEGKVTAVKAGMVTITATSEDNSEIKATCTVTVIQPVTGITLSESTYEMKAIGEIIQLTTTVLPEDASNKKVNWSSSNSAVCMVSNGNVVAVGYGTSVIIAATEDGGFMATCTITVEDTTGIIGNKKDNSDTCPTYDVMGRKVQNLVKGQLYIRQGKIFVVQ